MLFIWIKLQQYGINIKSIIYLKIEKNVKVKIEKFIITFLQTIYITQLVIRLKYSICDLWVLNLLYIHQKDFGVCQEFCVNRFNKQHRIAA